MPADLVFARAFAKKPPKAPFPTARGITSPAPASHSTPQNARLVLRVLDFVSAREHCGATLRVATPDAERRATMDASPPRRLTAWPSARVPSHQRARPPQNTSLSRPPAYPGKPHHRVLAPKTPSTPCNWPPPCAAMHPTRFRRVRTPKSQSEQSPLRARIPTHSARVSDACMVNSRFSPRLSNMIRVTPNDGDALYQQPCSG